jgi:hypothetical protein
MALLPFLKKPEATEEPGDDSDKKIEFAQKLPNADIEGDEAPKGVNFDFLKNTEPRNPGEKAAVKITEEEPVSEKDDEEELEQEEKASGESWFSRLLKFGTGGENKSSQVLEVNLVRGEIVKFFDWQRGILILLVAVFITVAALSGMYWGISWWGSSNQSIQSSNYLQQYFKISKEIKDLDPQVNEVVNFKNRLDQVNFLLERHIYWTNFFSFLEDNTLSDVYFSGFSGTVNGNYVLGATTDSLDAIDAQTKKLLANPFIKEARVDSGTVSGANGKPVVTFSLTFTLDPKIFLK